MPTFRSPRSSMSAATALLGLTALFTTGLAHASLVPLTLTLQANTIGPDLPVFGFSQLPGTPFIGTLTVNETGLAANSYVSVQVTDLDLHIGTAQFNAVSFIDAHFTTDSSGAIDLSAPFLLEQHLALDPVPPGGGDRTLLLSQGTSPAIGWVATYGNCSIDTSPPYSGIQSGQCLGGMPGTVTLARTAAQQLPEPSSLPLAALALFAGLALRLRSRGEPR